MFGSLDASTSALVANRQRLEVVTSNILSANTIEDANGNYAPFRRRLAILSQGDPSTGNKNGVHVREIQLDYETPFRRVLDPGHPHSDSEGYVEYPNIDPSIELMNALEISRAYEANITTIEATKNMARTALRLLA